MQWKERNTWSNCFRYKNEKNALVVSVVKCRDLPAKDPNLGSSDPYVKLQLLPDKQHKVKTRVLRKTHNPVYDEDFTFYGINFNQLQACIHSIHSGSGTKFRHGELSEALAEFSS
jgi:Ca2+-dependent lipid-binding protein